jgi:hypothetical protein
MTQRAPARSPAVHAILVLVLFAVLGWEGVASLFDSPQTDPRHHAITVTAFGTVFGWGLGVFLWLCARLPRGFYRPETIAARTLYTAGCVMCLLHVAVAFHTAHAWSHAAAWKHVERTGGFGWGLYVNYLFVVVWLADVAWSWVRLDSYRNRPRWVSWSVHGFMAFIVFNATVVFGTGWVRVFGVLMFALIALQLWLALRWPETPEPGSRPGSAESVTSPRDHSPT